MKRRKKAEGKLPLNSKNEFTDVFGIRKKSTKEGKKENIQVMDIYELDDKERAEQENQIKHSSRYLHDVSEEDTSRNMLNKVQNDSRSIPHEEFVRNVNKPESDNDVSGYFDLLRSLSPPAQSKQKPSYKKQNRNKN